MKMMKITQKVNINKREKNEVLLKKVMEEEKEIIFHLFTQ